VGEFRLSLFFMGITMGRITDRGHDGGDVYRWQTLERFIKENEWKCGAELGVWYGETFKYLIRSCPDLYLIGVDLYAEQPNNDGPQRYLPGEDGHGWEHERYYTDIKTFCAEHPGRGVIIRDHTIKAAERVEDASLDFVFIDADHSTSGVDADITHWKPKVKKGGYIIGHDIHWPTVKAAVEMHFGSNYKTEQDFIWYVVKE
jgi:hypothetical protein